MEEVNNEYLVLARKYRPRNFSELVGQKSLVQTITNAIKTNRIAHAFILTGIRGVGKTTTARIIAKALNCIGEDGAGGATANPCGVCDNCKSISEDRNVDVIEKDAASQTGVNDIRDIIDNVKYMPVSCRYKIYIIDEVHMLSKQAFNALLKTLEEPPPHVKFIFATTEIRKIPLTILSRCQRFDLSRVDVETISKHLLGISAKEGFKLEDEAAELIARAAEGSVRDSLSMLDQALSSSEDKNISTESVKKMLGTTDKKSIFDLFEQAAGGDIKSALRNIRQQYDNGIEPFLIMEDLLDLTHYLSVIKIDPETETKSQVGESDIKRAKEMSLKLSTPFLARVWQILLKGLNEVKFAENQLAAAEMVLIKLGYTSELPTPSDLIKKISSGKTDSQQNPASLEKSSQKELILSKASSPIKSEPVKINSFNELVKLFETNDELFIHGWLMSGVHLVSFEDGKLEFRQAGSAPKDLASRINKLLNEWTGKRWMVAISNNDGAKTLREQKQEEHETLKEITSNDATVKAVFDAFPGASIKSVKKHETKTEESINLKSEGKL